MVELRATEATLELYRCFLSFCGPTGRQKHASSAQGYVQMLCVSRGWVSFRQDPQFPLAVSLESAFIPRSFFLSSCYRLLSPHTGSVLHTDLFRVEPGDLGGSGEPMSITLRLWFSQLISASASLCAYPQASYRALFAPYGDDSGTNQLQTFIFPGERRGADPFCAPTA